MAYDWKINVLRPDVNNKIIIIMMMVKAVIAHSKKRKKDDERARRHAGLADIRIVCECKGEDEAKPPMPMNCLLSSILINYRAHIRNIL